MAKKRRSGQRHGQAKGKPTGGTRVRTEVDERQSTKAQRRDAARRQREEIRRRMARRERVRRVGISVVIAAGVAVALLLITRPKSAPVTSADQRLLAQYASAVKTAGCTDVKNVGPFQPESEDRLHIGTAPVQTMPPLSAYPSVPPASGPHNPVPLDAGVYTTSPPIIDQAIHSLEHAAVEIWYDPTATGPELTKIQDFFNQASHKDHVIVAPYSYPDQGDAGKLPPGVQMALVAWHHLQTCKQLNLPVAFNFVAHYRFPAVEGEKYLGDAPEQGLRI